MPKLSRKVRRRGPDCLCHSQKIGGIFSGTRCLFNYGNFTRTILFYLPSLGWIFRNFYCRKKAISIQLIEFFASGFSQHSDFVNGLALTVNRNKKQIITFSSK